MSSILEQLREESRKEGIQEGIKKTNFNAVKRMLASGSLTTQQISEYLELPIEEVEDIKLNLAN